MTNKRLPKVTIVTATYNLIKNGREKFFRECVESVHHQTYTNIEHLIIDGASTDGTLDLIKEYEQKGWIKYLSEPDQGMCDAMNKGIQKATGEYIAILNSDDWYTENAIELSVQKIIEENADYSYAITNMLSRDGKKLIRKWEVPLFHFAFCFMGTPFNHESMLLKKKIYEGLNYYDWKQYDTIADYDLILKLILNDYKGVYVEKAILNFRMDGTTCMSSDDKKKETYKKHIRYLFKCYRNIWSQFLPDESLIDQILVGEDYIKDTSVFFTDSFIYPFIRYICKKDLKNYPYDVLFNTVWKRDNNALKNTKNTKKYELFGFIPLIKIKTKVSSQKQKTKRIYYFLNIPFLKVEKKQK